MENSLPRIIINRRTVKVKELGSPFSYYRSACDFIVEGIYECLEQCREVQPVFNRDGWYYCRMTKRAIIEFGGRCWEYDTSGFLWELDHNFEERRMSVKSMQSIAWLMQEGLAPAELITLYWRETHVMELRQTYRNACLHSLEIRKEMLYERTSRKSH